MKNRLFHGHFVPCLWPLQLCKRNRRFPLISLFISLFISLLSSAQPLSSIVLALGIHRAGKVKEYMALSPLNVSQVCTRCRRKRPWPFFGLRQTDPSGSHWILCETWITGEAFFRWCWSLWVGILLFDNTVSWNRSSLVVSSLDFVGKSHCESSRPG